VLYCLVQLDVVLLYLYLLLVGLWHQNMLSLMVTQAAYQMLYHFDKSKTHICYISLIKGAVSSLFLTRCPPIGFTSIKHKGHMPYCLVYQMVWAPISERQIHMVDGEIVLIHLIIERRHLYLTAGQ
jgi:hypothetical protein